MRDIQESLAWRTVANAKLCHHTPVTPVPAATPGHTPVLGRSTPRTACSLTHGRAQALGVCLASANERHMGPSGHCSQRLTNRWKIFLVMNTSNVHLDAWGSSTRDGCLFRLGRCQCTQSCKAVAHNAARLSPLLRISMIRMQSRAVRVTSRTPYGAPLFLPRGDRRSSVPVGLVAI